MVGMAARLSAMECELFEGVKGERLGGGVCAFPGAEAHVHYQAVMLTRNYFTNMHYDSHSAFAEPIFFSKTVGAYFVMQRCMPGLPNGVLVDLSVGNWLLYLDPRCVYHAAARDKQTALLKLHANRPIKSQKPETVADLRARVGEVRAPSYVWSKEARVHDAAAKAKQEEVAPLTLLTQEQFKHVCLHDAEMCTKVKYDPNTRTRRVGHLRVRGAAWLGFFPNATPRWHKIEYASLKSMGLPMVHVMNARQKGGQLHRWRHPGARVPDAHEDSTRDCATHGVLVRAQLGRRTCTWNAMCNLIATQDKDQAARLAMLVPTWTSQMEYDSIASPMEFDSKSIMELAKKLEQNSDFKVIADDMETTWKLNTGMSEEEVQKRWSMTLEFVMMRAHGDALLLLQPVGANGDASHVIGVHGGKSPSDI